MSKDLSAKYYQDNEERLQTKLVKEIKVFLKKKKKRSNDIVVNDTKDLPEDEKQKLVGYKHNITIFHYNYKILFLFGKFYFFLYKCE